MNDIELLNAIKNDMGLEGKGIGKRSYNKSGKPRKPRTPKKAEDSYDKLIKALEGKKLEYHGAGLDGAGFFSSMLSMLPVVGSVAGPLAKKVGLGVSAGGLSAGGVSAGGVSAGGITAGSKPKRKYVKKGRGLVSGLLSMVPAVGPVLAHAYEAKQKYGKGIIAGNVNLSAGAKPKRKYIKKQKGAGLLDVMSKVANISPFTDVTSGNPLSKLFGQENVRDIAAKLATKAMGGKKKRGPKSNRRAEIVKKVMAEEGLNMIQASKYVKEHNLY